jgi:hypothetical protein
MSQTRHICANKTYYYNGWDFEYLYYGGPWPLKKDGDPRKCCGEKFWKDIYGFLKLSDEDKKQYQTGEGCIRFLRSV